MCILSAVGPKYLAENMLQSIHNVYEVHYCYLIIQIMPVVCTFGGSYGREHPSAYCHTPHKVTNHDVSRMWILCQ